jgi:hypothetical protein
MTQPDSETLHVAMSRIHDEHCSRPAPADDPWVRLSMYDVSRMASEIAEALLACTSTPEAT